jgi:hypothetical protein
MKTLVEIDEKVNSLEIALEKFITYHDLVLSRLERETEESRKLIEKNDKQIGSTDRLIERISKLIEENSKQIKESDYESDKKFEETRKLIEENSKQIKESDYESDRKFEETRKLIEENNKQIKESDYESDRKFEETRKLIEENSKQIKESDYESDRKFEETRKLIEENNKQIKESDYESDKKFEETRKLLEKNNKEIKDQIRENNKQWGALAKKMGTIDEDLVAPATKPVMKKYFGCEPIDRTIRFTRHSGGESFEIDVLVVCETQVFMIEVKSTPKPEHVEEILAKVKDFKRFFPEYADKQIIPIFAGIVFPDEIIKYATKKGLYVMAYREWEYIDIINFNEIERKK